MKTKTINYYIIIGVLLLSACVPTLKNTQRQDNSLPQSFGKEVVADTSNIAYIQWKNYFNDTNLNLLIEEALKNNQELNIVWQEIEISKNEITARKGEYLPFVGLRAGAGLDKVGEYTRQGAVEENLKIMEDKSFPKPFTDYMVGAFASWELDVWKKLRNAKKVAALKYFSTMEGKNFLITNLVAEIAYSYYELLALDNLLEIIQQNVEIQSSAYQIVKQEKESAKVTQLAVNRFEAQLLNTQNLQYEVKQRIVETENRINFLLGRYPQPIVRNSKSFFDISLDNVRAGIPSQLLVNRPDVKQAELELQAARLDLQIAKANFYPSFRITAGAGFQAFNPSYLFSPQSVLYSLAGDAIAPLVNRNAIKATYFNANAKQIQTLYHYQRSILNAYVEVLNQLAKADNYSQSYQVKRQEVEILNQSVDIANNLYRNARADYMEVLLTQREALNEKLELVDVKARFLESKVGLYRALGGGWR
ncbi:TolC family protein [Thermoflexibacter ruber]|uniref:Efflux transporter, outer membrane factor (OMF) lipoprotein, NodT family n=1 Tax=Thermoflexibacter ruber TaxID=1003 RepID=A0A1I2INY2_9BACT|nr:efflux transporter outer membrane subunit [Thermoflexibacter ruber]SFF43974.1 efflux transporter, outer membrane factor (OMF) lipoprotein, NodT family [Thermoflexibacter ruber]